MAATVIGMTEEWRQVPGYGGAYEASTEGRVRSWRPWRTPAPRLLTPCDDGHGYGQLTLVTPEGRQVKVKAHAVIAAAFLGPRPTGLQVLHVNGDRGDARASNLSYGTQAENEADKIEHGTHNRGTRHHSTHLSDADVRAIRAKYAAGHQQASLGREYGIAQPTVSDIVRRKQWGWLA